MVTNVVFVQTTYHGFPNGPTALAFDKDSQLLVIGTKFGELRVFGRPGVEFSVVCDTGSPITALFAISGLHQLISVSADNSIVTWELATEGKPTLSIIKEFRLDPEGYVCVYISGEPVMFFIHVCVNLVSIAW